MEKHLNQKKLLLGSSHTTKTSFLLAAAVIAPSAFLWPVAHAEGKKLPIYKGKVFKGTPFPITKPIPLKKATGERLRLHIWAVLTPGAAPLDANGKMACYGWLRINDEERWALTREQAIPVAPGGRIEISGDTAHTKGGPFEFNAIYGDSSIWRGRPQFRFGLSSVSGGTVRAVARYLDDVDLLKWTGKEYRFKFGGGSAMLFMRVERVSYIYGFGHPRPWPRATPTPSPSNSAPRNRPR